MVGGLSGGKPIRGGRHPRPRRGGGGLLVARGEIIEKSFPQQERGKEKALVATGIRS